MPLQESSSLIDWRFTRNVVLKALALFIVFNIVFAAWNPVPWLGQISAYNILFPSRLPTVSVRGEC